MAEWVMVSMAATLTVARAAGFSETARRARRRPADAPVRLRRGVGGVARGQPRGVAGRVDQDGQKGRGHRERPLPGGARERAVLRLDRRTARRARRALVPAALHPAT